MEFLLAFGGGQTYPTCDEVAMYFIANATTNNAVYGMDPYPTHTMSLDGTMHPWTGTHGDFLKYLQTRCPEQCDARPPECPQPCAVDEANAVVDGFTCTQWSSYCPNVAYINNNFTGSVPELVEKCQTSCHELAGCLYTAVEGCMEPNANNYDPAATVQKLDIYGDKVCQYDCCGGADGLGTSLEYPFCTANYGNWVIHGSTCEDLGFSDYGNTCTSYDDISQAPPCS
jgi:hypothetical protein